MEKDRAYVVIGTSNYGLDEQSENLYAGKSESTARMFNTDLNYHTLCLEVWVEGVMIQKYIKKQTDNWEIIFDKIKSLMEDMEEKEFEKRKIKDELDKINRILGKENNIML